MGSTGNLMVAGDGLNAGANMAGGFASYNALNSRANFTLQQAGFNNEMASIQQDQVRRRGTLAADAAINRGKQVAGSQVARAAAQGVDVHSGSVTALTNETQGESEADALMASNNAWREAWGIGVKANDQNYQAQWNALGLRNEANQTLLTGGLQAVGYGLKAYRDYRSNAPGSQTTTNQASPFDTMPSLPYHSATWGDF